MDQIWQQLLQYGLAGVLIALIALAVWKGVPWLMRQWREEQAEVVSITRNQNERNH